MCNASEAELHAAFIRFSPLFREPKEDREWIWELTQTSWVSQDLAFSAADMLSTGGCDAIKISQPGPRLSMAAQNLEKKLYPARAARRESDREARVAKSKGKGKDKQGDATMGVDQAADAGGAGGAAGAVPPVPQFSPPATPAGHGVPESVLDPAAAALAQSGLSHLAAEGALSSSSADRGTAADRDQSRTPRGNG